MVNDAPLLPTIDILEGLETLMDKAPSGEIEGILQAASCALNASG